MADPFKIQQERVASDPRRQWGWGPSVLASNEEKDAYRVSQGESPRDIRNDPAFRDWAYTEGGYPKSRRQMRMQAEWKSQQDEELKKQAALQAMDIQQKQFEMDKRDQQMQEDGFYYERGLKEAGQKLQAQTRSEATAIIGGLNQLDPRSPDYQKNVAVLFGSNPLGAADPNVQKVASQYSAANDFYVNSLTAQSEQQKKDAEEQAQLQADVVTYGITPEQQKKMLEPNLPAGVVRFNPNAAKPIIAEAKLSQEGAKEAKTEERAQSRDFTSRLRDQQKALATYNAILQPELERIDSMTVSDVEKNKAKKNVNLIPELKEAFAKVKGAAAVLELPMIQNKSDLSKYKKGDRVLAPDGITVITVP